MEEDYIPISTLNDFIFCPYSIYLHNVYVGTDDDVYQAFPQVRGDISHETIENKTYGGNNDIITSLTVYSNELGIVGKIDIYNKVECILIERKYELKKIYNGQIYQLWAQYFCMMEMGYDVKSLEFYEMSRNKKYPIDIPDDFKKRELINFIDEFRNFNPESYSYINPNKCVHCIYCNLCDKGSFINVY